MSLSKLQRSKPLLKGSIGETHFKCGKANCSCTKGLLHAAHYLSYRQAGKTHTVYIPKALVAKVTNLCHNWRKFNNLIEGESHRLVQEMLRSYKTKQKQRKR